MDISTRGSSDYNNVLTDHHCYAALTCIFYCVVGIKKFAPWALRINPCKFHMWHCAWGAELLLWYLECHGVNTASFKMSHWVELHGGQVMSFTTYMMYCEPENKHVI